MRCLFRRIRAQAPEGPRMQDILFSLFRGVVCDLSPREVNVHSMTFMYYYIRTAHLFHPALYREDRCGRDALSSVHVRIRRHKASWRTRDERAAPILTGYYADAWRSISLNLLRLGQEQKTSER